MPFFGRKKQSSASTPSDQLFLGDDGIAAVCTAAGLPSELLDNHTIARYIVPTCAAVFTDGDVVVRHTVRPPSPLIEWFGQNDVTEGRFSAHLTDLHQNPTTGIRRELEDLQRAVAALVARGVVVNDGPLPMHGLQRTLPPLARIEGATVVFGHGEYREPLDGPVKYLLAIEPGIRLMHVIDQQVELLSRPAFSYNYMCLTSQPFASQFLGNYLLLRARQASGHDGMSDEMINRGFVIPAEGDITTSLRRFVALDRKMGETHGRVDLAFFVGPRPPRLTPQQAHHILTHVHFLIRPGGALLIGFPVESQAPHHVSGVDLNTIALEAGFSGASSRIHLGTSNLANPALPVYTFLRKN